MPNPDQNQQDPWAVVSQAPAPSTPNPTAAPVSQANDPWRLFRRLQGLNHKTSMLSKLCSGKIRAWCARTEGICNRSVGRSDVLHGNVRQGLSKIWESEAPHVVQGSPMKK